MIGRHRWSSVSASRMADRVSDAAAVRRPSWARSPGRDLELRCHSRTLPTVQSTWIRAAAIAAGLLAAAACGGSDSAASPSTSAAPRPTSTVEQKAAETSTTVAVSPVIIGLVAPSAVDDASFTQSMVDSLARLAADRPIEIDVAAVEMAGLGESQAGRGQE